MLVKPPSVRRLCAPSLLRHQVVIIAIALAAPLLPLPAAFAIPIPVALGPTGIVNGVRQVDVTAPNVQFLGQTIQLDFNFQSGEFIRLFTGTNFFQTDIFFRINSAPIPQIFTGSGYLTSFNGDALGPLVILQAFPVIDMQSQIGVDLLLRPLTSFAVPADAYGIHLELTLPDSPGFGFVNSPGPGAIVFDGNLFGIGPGIPGDLVPEVNNTIALFAVALAALTAARISFRRT